MSYQAGDLISGKYKVKSTLDGHGPASRYLATYQQQGMSVVVGMVNLDGLSAPERSELAQSLSAAPRIRHKNVIPCVGFGEERGCAYLVEKASDSRSLAEHLERRLSVNRPFEPVEAYSLLSHLCNGIQYCFEHGGHGLVTPSNVMIQANGRVQVSSHGFAGLRQRWTGETKWDQGCLRPENDDPPIRHDIFGLAVIAGQLLTGKPWPGGLMEPPADIDPRIMERLQLSLKTASEGGYDSPLEFRRAVKSLFVVDAHATDAPADASSPLGSLRGDDSDSAFRWLIERDGVDFGPFTKSQILEQLAIGELTPRSVLVDIESDTRSHLAEFEVFEAAMLESLHKKDERETSARNERNIRRAKTDKRIKLWGSLVAVFLIASAIGIWQYQLAHQPEPVRLHLASAVESLEWILPVIPAPESIVSMDPQASNGRVPSSARGKGNRHSRRARGKTWSRSEAAQMRREAEMAANSDLSDEGSRRRPFSRAAFDRVLASRSRLIYRCLIKELKARPGTQDMAVTLTAMSSGKILNVQLNGGTVQGIRCLRRAFKGTTIPPFAGTNKSITLPYRLN